MSREVRHDGAGALQVRFPFDRALVDLIKTLTHRRWNAAERFWWVPDIDVVELVDLLEPQRFRFDAATRALYHEFGGKLPLEDAEAAPAPPADTDDYTVSRLNEQVKRVIEAAFPQAVWLVGEISGFNRSAHKRHVSFQLAEKADDGKTVSKLDATLFGDTRHAIERTLAQAGEPFRIEDEVTVRIRVRVELYVPWGSYRVVVEDLDVNYTLGEAARRREEVIRRLTEAGLIGVNSALPMPALPLRVGLVTSIGSDAYNDVLRTLQESGYAFRVVAHGARVQGHATEPSVLNALDAFRARADELDVVLICRGGGSRTTRWTRFEPVRTNWMSCSSAAEAAPGPIWPGSTPSLSGGRWRGFPCPLSSVSDTSKITPCWTPWVAGARHRPLRVFSWSRSLAKAWNAWSPSAWRCSL